MKIHIATSLWLTMLSILSLRVFSSLRRNPLTSFQDFATALIRRCRCSIPYTYMNLSLSRKTMILYDVGSEERGPFYEKRNYYQFNRQ